MHYYGSVNLPDLITKSANVRRTHTFYLNVETPEIYLWYLVLHACEKVKHGDSLYVKLIT
jgi:hypothetical protein